MEQESSKNRKIYFFNYGSGNFHELYNELINNPPKGYEYNANNRLSFSVNDVSGLKKIKIIIWLGI